VKTTPAPTPQDLLLVDASARRFTQDRARKTYEALVDAAAAEFIENGYDATGTPDIAERAGVSVGTFYRYFDDKKQVYLEVARRHLAVAYHETMDRLTPARFLGKERKATIAETIDVVFHHVTAHPGLNRVFVEMVLRDSDVAALARAFDEVSRQRLAALIAAICPREVVPDPESTACVIHIASVECANLLAGVRGEPPVSIERAKVALTAMIHRTLFGLED
jgi:AcrR family transcriptional regulator